MVGIYQATSGSSKPPFKMIFEQLGGGVGVGVSGVGEGVSDGVGVGVSGVGVMVVGTVVIFKSNGK